MVLNVLKDGEDGRRFLTGRHGEVSVSAPPVPADTPTFLVTKEHRRFEEFANTVRKNVTSVSATGLPAWEKPSPHEHMPAPANGNNGSALMMRTSDPFHRVYWKHAPRYGRPK